MFLEDLKNRFDFFLRERITLSRKYYKEVPYSLSDIYFTKEQNDFYEKLSQKYNLSPFEGLSVRNFLENLYFLDVFDKYISKKLKTETSILDIGSKNWSYVRSEYLYFKSFNEKVLLNGIELDAYRLSSDFYTRYEIARFYKKDLPDTNYIAGDFMKHNSEYDYIIWILPFVTEYPLIKWGLPLKYFKPQEMLLHAYNMLNEGGQMLIINQGEEEANIQKDLLKVTNISRESDFKEIEDHFNLFKNKRYCFTIVKQ
ncbi:hypothetical protein IKQ21_02480 [bacterium]|nr:hypothetical protein [bacterium]